METNYRWEDGQQQQQFESRQAPQREVYERREDELDTGLTSTVEKDPQPEGIQWPSQQTTAKEPEAENVQVMWPSQREKEAPPQKEAKSNSLPSELQFDDKEFQEMEQKTLNFNRKPSQEETKQRSTHDSYGQNNSVEHQESREFAKAASQKSGVSSQKNAPQLDIDEMPIPASKPKTFEELLEEEMSKGNGGGGIIAAPSMQ